MDEVLLRVKEIHLEEQSHRIVAQTWMHHIFGEIEMTWEGSGRPKFDVNIGQRIAVSWRVVDD